MLNFSKKKLFNKNVSFKKEAKRKKESVLETTVKIIEKLDVQIKNMRNGLAKIVKHTENAVFQGEKLI